MAYLDVRPDLAAGREPLPRIMETVKALAADEPPDLVVPFEPVPLYRLMEARGYVHTTERADDGSWHVTFCLLTREE